MYKNLRSCCGQDSTESISEEQQTFGPTPQQPSRPIQQQVYGSFQQQVSGPSQQQASGPRQQQDSEPRQQQDSEPRQQQDSEPRQQQDSEPARPRVPVPGGKVILYSYWKSSCPWRIRIALNCKNVQYEIIPIKLKKKGGDQHSQAIRFLNPMQQIPIIIIDNQAFIESMNILFYLEETRPYPKLLPKDLIKRARVREICELIAYGLQPLINMSVMEHIEKERKHEWTKHWITRSFKAIEQLLVKSSVTFCVGQTITLADCCLVPQMYIAVKRSIDLRPYPNMRRVNRNLTTDPAFIMAHAVNQFDRARD